MKPNLKGKKKKSLYIICNSKSRVQWNSGKFLQANLLSRIYEYIPDSTLKMWKKQTSHTILYNPLEKFLPDCLFGCLILHLSTAIWFFSFSFFFCCQACLCLNHSPWEIKTPENKDWRESWDTFSYLNTSYVIYHEPTYISESFFFFSTERRQPWLESVLVIILVPKMKTLSENTLRTNKQFCRCAHGCDIVFLLINHNISSLSFNHSFFVLYWLQNEGDQ